MIKLLIGVAKWAGAGALTVLLAWQASSGPVREESEVIVHVAVSDVELWIDDHSFFIDRPWEHPVVCELPPGEHLLTMQRGGVEIYREVFTLEGGRGQVFTAWDENGQLRDASGVTARSAPQTAFQWEAVGRPVLRPIRRGGSERPEPANRAGRG